LQKYGRFIAVFILFLGLLIAGAGCTGQDSQEAPENRSQPAQQQQQPAQIKDEAKASREVTGQKEENTSGISKNREVQQHLEKNQNNKADAGNQEGELKLLPATVTHVVDGDTIHAALAGGKEEKVRFIGVDTPESTREIEPYGKKAAAYTKKRLDGRKIWLEFDVEKRDRYGRLLAYIWLEKPAGTGEKEVRAKMFNSELLLEGYAHVMTIPPNVKYTDYFAKYQLEAREANKGLWGLAGEEEDYYVASKKSNKFHRPDCKWGQEIPPHNLIKFNSKDEAFDAGYEPCRACDP